MATLVALVLAEGGLRVYLRFVASDERRQHYASLDQLRRELGPERLIPHRFLGYVTAPAFEKGANRHDRRGFRGPEVIVPKPAGVYRVVCIGGSTTYGDGVEDHRQAFPAQLERQLQGAGHGGVEVVNAGVPGYSSLESLSNLQLRVLELEPDLVLVHHGVNDARPRFVWPPDAYRPDQSGLWKGPTRTHDERPWEASTLARVVAIRLDWIEPHRSVNSISELAETYLGETYRRQVARRTYPSGPFASLPVERILERNPPRHFERNLRSIIAVARAHGAEVVLSTVPCSAAFAHRYPLPADPLFRQAVDDNHAIVRRVGRALAVPVVDAARDLPEDAPLFTDGIHLTAAGNELRARITAPTVLALLDPPGAAVSP